MPPIKVHILTQTLILMLLRRRDLSESSENESGEDVAAELGGGETEPKVGQRHYRPQEDHCNLQVSMNNSSVGWR